MTYERNLSLQGEGPPLVFVPGMDGTGQLFYRQMPGLTPTYRVATYRLRDEATDMTALVADLAEVIEEASPSGAPAVVVGESFGGALSLSFALERPDLVDALVIINSFPRFLPQVRLRLSLAAIRAIPWKAMTLVRRVTAFRMHSKFTHREEIRRFLSLTAATSKRGYANRLRILQRYDVRDRLGEIRARTLFLAAERDHLVPSVEQAEYMAERVPGATLKILSGHGHICLIAPNLDLARILADWRGSLPNAGSGRAAMEPRATGSA